MLHFQDIDKCFLKVIKYLNSVSVTLGVCSKQKIVTVSIPIGNCAEEEETSKTNKQFNLLRIFMLLCSVTWKSFSPKSRLGNIEANSDPRNQAEQSRSEPSKFNFLMDLFRGLPHQPFYCDSATFL